MKWVVRAVCLTYVAALTILLLVKRPMELVAPTGWFVFIAETLEPWMHFLSFAGLSCLVLLAGWPLRWRTLILLLAAYAALTELAQFFVPPRTPEWNDWFQDIAGIATGVLLACVIGVTWTACRAARKHAPSAGAEHSGGDAEQFPSGGAADAVALGVESPSEVR